MKTSNKLLIGAFIVIVLCMIAANLAFKYEISKAADNQNQYNQIDSNDNAQGNNQNDSIQVN